MIIPIDYEKKKKYIRWIVDCCTASQQDRAPLYQKRRRYFVYGQNQESMVRYNRLKSHLSLVRSFIYSSDGLQYAIAAPANADDLEVQKYLAIEDDWNQDFRDSGLADLFDMAVLWGLALDTMVIKQGWNDRTQTGFGKLIEPTSFGVFDEADYDFSNQQAMVHSYAVDFDQAVQLLVRAGKADEIARLTTVGAEGDNGLPEAVNRMIISATGGTNLAGNIIGETNLNYEAQPLYAPRLDNPLVRFHEVHVWDSDATDDDGKAGGDWRVFNICDPDILIDDSKETLAALKKAASNGHKPKWDSSTNPFLRGENPFTPVTPFQIFNYFWGECHQEDLIPLQAWSNDRLDGINEILERQQDPAKSFTGFMSMDENKAEAWGGPGTAVFDQVPGSKAEMHPPEMPNDLFAEFNEIGNLMMEQSGLTEGIVGRGEKNVRGAGHHKELKITGGGRIRQVAIGLEKSLVRLGDIGLRLKAKNDDEAIKLDDDQKTTFVLAQVLGEHKHTIRVAGHSQSPLFISETRDLAAMLLKAQAIDREWFIRMMNPPQKDNLLHALHKRIRAENAIRQQQAQAAAAAGQQPGAKRSHHKQA